MAILIPNILGADAFTVQADARDARFTWKREGNKTVPGLIIAGKPSLRFPLPGQADAAALRSAIDAAASQDDVMAWAYAARWWISYAWERYQEAGPDGVWQQLDWAGAVSPDTLPPTTKSLVNGMSMGGLEILVDEPWLFTDSWSAYFNSLVVQIVTQSIQFHVSTLIEIQMAMRSVAWWMSSMIVGTQVQFQLADVCALAKAWRKTPTAECALAPDLSQINAILAPDHDVTTNLTTSFVEAVAGFYTKLRSLVDSGQLSRTQGFYYLNEILRLEEQWDLACSDCTYENGKSPISSPSGSKYASLFTDLYDKYQLDWRPGKNGNPG